MLNSTGVVYRLSAWLEAFCYRHAFLITGQSKSILAFIPERFLDRLAVNLDNNVTISQGGVPLVIATIRRFLEAQRNN